MKEIYFKSPTGFIIGNGVIKKLGAHLNKLGIKKCLLISDNTLKELGIVDMVLDYARADGIEFIEYCGCLPDPPVENVYEALEAYRANGCQGILGLGGGSAMDVAKATSVLVTNPGSFEEYVGVGKVPNRGCPLVLAPTIAGSGSEIGMFAIMMVNGQKAGVVDQNLCADLALVDPELTVSCPRGLTAATGLDGLCHLIESYISNLTSPMAEMFCLEGIHYMVKYLRKAVGQGDNLEARYWVSYASSIGLFANNLTDGCAANHGLAFAIGGVYHISHGLSNAIVLPYVFPYVARAELDRMPRLAQAFGLNIEGKNNQELADAITEELVRLNRDVGCLIPLSKFGGKPEDIDHLVDETLAQTRVMGHSSWKLTADELREIFTKAM